MVAPPPSPYRSHAGSSGCAQILAGPPMRSLPSHMVQVASPPQHNTEYELIILHGFLLLHKTHGHIWTTRQDLWSISYTCV